VLYRLPSVYIVICSEYRSLLFLALQYVTQSVQMSYQKAPITMTRRLIRPFAHFKVIHCWLRDVSGMLGWWGVGLWKKPAHILLYPLQISRGLQWDWTRGS